MSYEKLLQDLLPGILAGVMSCLYAFFNSINTLFGGPEIPKPLIIKAYAEILIAFPITMIAGYAFATPLSYAMTSVCQVFSKGIEFNPVAAGVLIGFIGVHGTKALVDQIMRKVSSPLDGSNT